MQELSDKKAIIFACTAKSEKECLDRMLFGTGKIYADNALQTRKGDYLFLYNMDSDQLHGVFRAESVGAKNIVPEAWKGYYPYQVPVGLEGERKSIPNAKKTLSRLGINWHYPASPLKRDLLLRIFSSPEEFNWASLIADSRLQEEEKNVDAKPRPEATTLWDYPKQSYGTTPKGNNKYAGVTPAFILYNLLFRYTEPGDLVLDPMAGSGTTLDVCNEEGRRCIAYDIGPTRKDIIQNDARKIPLDDNSVDMIFVDSPYGDNIKYNEDPDNIGAISAETQEFYDELEKVIKECSRVLKDGKVLGWLIGDQWVKKKFTPVGFEVYKRLLKYFDTVDIVCVVRRSQSSNTGIWFNRAIRFNFFLRGYKYLFIMRKSAPKEQKGSERSVKWAYYDRQKKKSRSRSQNSDHDEKPQEIET